MSDDLFAALQLLEVQRKLRESNDLAARQVRVAEDTLEELRKKKDPPPPPQRFDLAAFKNRMNAIISKNDPLLLPDLRDFAHHLQRKCEVHATDINSFIDREVTEMAKTISATIGRWEPLYPAAAAAKAKKRASDAYYKELENRPKRVQRLRRYIALRQAIAIEAPLLPAAHGSNWSNWLGVYLLISSLLPIDTFIASGVVAMMLNLSLDTTKGLWIVMWLVKLLVLGPIVYWGDPSRRERRDIRRYLANRDSAFARAGLPPELAGPSYNKHIEESEELRRWLGVANPSEAQRELDRLIAAG